MSCSNASGLPPCALQSCPPVLMGPVVISRLRPSPWGTSLCAGPLASTDLLLPYTSNIEALSAILTCATAHTHPLGTFTACAPVTPREHVPLSAQCAVPSLSTPRLPPVMAQALTALGLSPCSPNAGSMGTALEALMPVAWADTPIFPWGPSASWGCQGSPSPVTANDCDGDISKMLPPSLCSLRCLSDAALPMCREDVEKYWSPAPPSLL